MPLTPLVLALWGLFSLGLALIWVGLALELNYRRERRALAAERPFQVDPPEEERTGA
jgi:hypothetical protein